MVGLALTITHANTGAAAVLVDQLDAGQLISLNILVSFCQNTIIKCMLDTYKQHLHFALSVAAPTLPIISSRNPHLLSWHAQARDYNWARVGGVCVFRPSCVGKTCTGTQLGHLRRVPKCLRYRLSGTLKVKWLNKNTDRTTDGSSYLVSLLKSNLIEENTLSQSVSSLFVCRFAVT